MPIADLHAPVETTARTSVAPPLPDSSTPNYVTAMGAVATGVTVALVLALGGCGGDDTASPPPTGPLAEALAGIGGGGARGSLGVGWADPRLVEESGVGAQTIADALVPNARSVIEEAPRLRRRFDLAPLSAERLISVGGSYAFSDLDAGTEFDERTVYDVGVTYTLDAVTVGIGYSHGEYDPSDELDQYQIGAAYALGPGVTLAAMVGYFDDEDGGVTDNDNEGYQVGVGTGINF